MQVNDSCCRNEAGGVSVVKPNVGKSQSISFLLIVGGSGLPGCLSHAGDFAFVGKIPEADTADTELTEICMGTAADLATVVTAR